MKRQATTLDASFIVWLQRYKLVIARVSIFIVYFWFGILKVLDASPAGPVAEVLVEKTVGLEHFDTLFVVLGLLECLIGVLFLFPKAIRLVFPLVIIHLVIVCAPLVLVPDRTWVTFLAPTLEGQYIIKNVLIAALAITVAASAQPLKSKTK